MAVHPDPHIPFIRTGRPVINTAGEEQTEFTLAQLDALAQSWSVWYHEQGVGPRDRVALYIADTFAYSIHLNALAQLGAIGVLINSKASPALALGLCERTTPVGIYTDRSRLAAIAEGIGSLDGLRWIQLAEDLPAPPPAALPDAWRFRHAPEDPVSIMHSSGTTGIPKAVTQTHASSVAGPRFRLENYTEPANELMMTAQPQSHLGCIVYTAYSILAGTPLVALYDPSGEELAAALRQHQPKAVMAFAHAYAELAALDTPERHRRFGRLLGHHGRRHPRGPHPGDPGQAQPGPAARHLLRPLRHDRARLGSGGAAPDAVVGAHGPAGRQARSRRRGRGAAGGRQQGAGGRGGFLRGQGPVHHRRVLERRRHHLSLEAGRLLADRRPGVPGRGRQLLRGGPDGGRHRDRRGHRLLGAHGGGAAQ